MTNIVKVNTTLIPKPELNRLQKCVFVSEGATSLAPQTLSRITNDGVFDALLNDGSPISSLSKLDLPILDIAQKTANISEIEVVSPVISSLTWSAGTVTLTTATPHGLPPAIDLMVVVQQCSVASYNGTIYATTIDANTLTYKLPYNPVIVPTAFGVLSYCRYTAVGHGFPIQTPVFAMLEGGTGSLTHRGIRSCYIYNSSIIFAAQKTGAASFVGLTTAKISYNLLTTAPHGIALHVPIDGVVSGITPAAYNATGRIVAFTATTIAYPSLNYANPPILSGNSRVKTFKLTTINNSGLPLIVRNSVILTGQVPKTFSSNISLIMATSTEGYFTYSAAMMASAHTVPTTLGSISSRAIFDLNGMYTSWNAQNEARDEYKTPYVLEVGAQISLSSAIAQLSLHLSNNPDYAFAYVLPRSWNGLDLKNLIDANYGKLFFITESNVEPYAYAGSKGAVVIKEPVTVKPDEYHAAIYAYNTCNFNPDSGRVNQLLYSTTYKTTPFIINEDDEQSITSRKVACIVKSPSGTAQPNLLVGTETSDSMSDNLLDVSFWRAVHWIEDECKAKLTAEVIAGSDTQPQLTYTQYGINRLRIVAQQVINRAYDAGLIVDNVDVIAVPFVEYKNAHPDHYTLRQYNGLSVTITPIRGFKAIVVNLFVNQG